MTAFKKVEMLYLVCQRVAKYHPVYSVKVIVITCCMLFYHLLKETNPRWTASLAWLNLINGVSTAVSLAG